jgi:hypothetical protein
MRQKLLAAGNPCPSPCLSREGATAQRSFTECPLFDVDAIGPPRLFDLVVAGDG